MTTPAAGPIRRARLAMVTAMFAVAMLFALVAAGNAHAANDVFVYTGGTTHANSAAAASAIQAMAGPADFDVTASATFPAAGNGAGQLGFYRAVVLINGGSLTVQQQTDLLAFVNSGRGVVAIGPAIELNQGAADMNTLLGISSNPRISATAASAQRTIEAVDRAHPASRVMPLLSQRTGTFYEHGTAAVTGGPGGGGTFVAPAGTSHVVLRYRLTNQERTDDGFRTGSTTRPLAWCRDQQNGRTFYSGIGSAAADWSNNNILAHVRGAIEYAGGLSRGDCRATIPGEYSSVRVMTGGSRAEGLVRSGEPHGLTVADNGWAIYTGRADCATNAERGAVAGTGATARILNFDNPNVSIGCGTVHVFDPSQYTAQNTGITRAGTLAVYGDRGGGNAVNGKIETGIQSIVAAPNFSTTGHVYIYYYATLNPNTMPPGPADSAQRRVTKQGEARVSRFTINLSTKQLNLASEVVVLKWNSQIWACCHNGGGMDFDSAGNLYVVTGDNSSEGGNVSAYSAALVDAEHLCPTNGSADPASANGNNCGNNPANGFYRSDARRTAGSSNDLNGSMIRIKPIPAATSATPTGIGTTYTIPTAADPNGPNLFSGTEGNGNQARPEIYAMGFRNPGRVHVDPNTDVPYAAWVGPDGGSASNSGGMGGQEHWARIPEAGNYGWPYCAGGGADGRPISYKARNGESGPGYITGPDGTNQWFDCNNLRNDSPSNTGLVTLPHSTGTGKDAGRAKPATIWYGRPGGSCLDYPRTGAGSTAVTSFTTSSQLCPYVTQGSAIMAGPVYGYESGAADNSMRWPAFWDSNAFLFDWSAINGGKVGFQFEPGSVDQPPASATRAQPFISWGTSTSASGAYMFGDFGPDGALYIQTYGEVGYSFGRGPNDGLVRISYQGGPPRPNPDPQLVSTTPNVGTFSIGTSGGIEYEWAFQGGGTSTSANPVHNFGSGGQKQVTLTVTYADGEEVSKTITVTIPGEGGDTTPPVTTHAFNPAAPNGNNGWRVSPTTISLSATDDYGVAGTQYCFGTDCVPNLDYTAPVAPVADGQNIVFRYRSTDTSSNVEATKTAPTFNYDNTVPSSSASMVPSTPNGEGGAWLVGAQLSITSTDATSGVAQIQYSLNGGTTWQTYNNASRPSFNTAGAMSVQYRATDMAGNVEAAKTITFNITEVADDIEPPVSAYTIDPYAPQGLLEWYTSNPTVTLTADDDQSGVDEIQYRLGASGPFLTYEDPFVVPDGDKTIQFRAIDIAGNVEEANTLNVKVDPNAPVSSISFDPTNPGGGGTYEDGPVSFTLSANDPHSGVNRIEYRVGGGAFVPAAGAVELDGIGTYEIEFRAIDNAGNTEATRSTTITIDPNGASLPPVTPVIVSPVDPPVIVSLGIANDSVNAIEYRTRYSHNGVMWHSGEPWGAYSGPLFFDTPGEWIIYYRWRNSTTGQWSEEVAVPFTVAGSPPPPTRLSLSITPRNKKVRANRVVRVKSVVRNNGDLTATNVRVCVTVPKRAAKVNGPKCQTIASLAPGATWASNFRVKKTSTGNQARARFTLTSPEAAKRTSDANVRLRR